MSTIHEEALTKATERALEREPGLAAILVDVRRKMEGGFYPELYVNAVVQSGWNRRLSLEDVYAFTQIWTHRMIGDLCCAEINVHEEPHPDASVARNQVILDRELPRQFRAVVISEQGASADSDGQLYWDEPINMDRYFAEEGRNEPCIWKPAFVPLEIGSTQASRTLMHLRAEHCVARWPYGSEKIVVFRMHPSFKQSSIWSRVP